ncbi:MAG: NADH-quinone oxidoreductase subunit NuoN [Candidatus Methylopumilus sp.]|nr:NADH-quinone oxidoreductase subunit NuoN [Candidatus Methylopumilus sp.]
MNELIQFDLSLIMPEIFVLSMAMVVLMTDLFIKPSSRWIIYSLSQLTLLGSTYLTGKDFAEETQFAFSNMFVRDGLADFLKMISYLGISLTFLYSRSYMKDRGLYRGEYFALVLFALLGMMIMISSHNMLLVYMGLELLSLCLYSITALDRDNQKATESAIKYFVLGALASGLLLYGMSMIYGATSSLDIGIISTTLFNHPTDHSILVLGLVFVLAGLAFKLGAVPFQMWVPDVYEGAPSSIAMLISSVPKLAAFAITIRLLADGLQSMIIDWKEMLLIMAVLSISIGNITAIAQKNIKRMYAYSTISHIGFILFGVMSGSLNGYASSLFYVASYMLMTLVSFAILMIMSNKNFECELIEDFKGLNKRSPWYAFLMLIVMLSMAGIPPTIGFYAKFMVLQAALEAGFVGFVIYAVMMVLVGMFYYLRIVKLMYFDEPKVKGKIEASLDVQWVLSLNALSLLIIGLVPYTFMEATTQAISLSLN